MKSQIEARINAIANYTGSQDLPRMITQAMSSKAKLGSEPGWMVARACMTPAEYAAFGNDGKAWQFLRGKPELAQRVLDVVRKVVDEKCSAMNLQCDWSKIPRDRDPESTGARTHLAHNIAARSVKRMDTSPTDQASPAAAFERLSRERSKFFTQYGETIGADHPEIAP